MKQILLAATLAGTLALAIPAHAALVMTQSTLATSVAEGFTGLPVNTTSPQSAGGVNVKYNGTNSGINTNFLSNTDLSWRPLFGQGNTDVTFAAGLVDAFGFSAGQANNANPNLPFTLNVDVFSGGVLKASFSSTAISFATLKDFSITGTSAGDLFDEVKLSANFGAMHPTTGVPDEFLGDNFKFDASFLTTTSVPEPSTWALMLAGFGGIGAMLRKRRIVAA